MRPEGKLCIVGVPRSPTSVGFYYLLLGERSIVGGQLGSIDGTRQMLAFTARYSVQAMIETFPIRAVNALLDHAGAGRAIVRFLWREGSGAKWL